MLTIDLSASVEDAVPVFQGVEKVFCESSLALDRAFALGLTKDVLVCGKSPVLRRRRDINMRELKPAPDDANREFYFDTHTFLLKCYEQLVERGIPKSQAVSHCQTLWLWSNDVLVAAYLEPKDFKEPALILNVDFPANESIGSFHLPWGKFLQKNDAVREAEILVDFKDPFSISEVRPTFMERLSVMGIRHIGWRAAQYLWAMLPNHWGNRKLYYHRENELLRDIATQFVSRGYRPVRLTYPVPDPDPIDHGTANSLVENLRPLLNERVCKLVKPVATDLIIEVLTKMIATNLTQYSATSQDLEKRISAHCERSRTIFLANIPYGPNAAALSDFTETHDLVFAGVQHGVTREFLDRPQNLFNYENVSAPLMVAMTPKAGTISAENSVSSGKDGVIVAGLPKDFRYKKSKKRSSRILYVGTLYQFSYFFNAGNYTDDNVSLDREIDLFEKVLKNLPHAVSFKPYPMTRYLDEDPLIESVEKIKNIRIEKTAKDLRFLIDKYGLIITKGATSTLSWCFASGRPFIFINPSNSGYRMCEKVSKSLETIGFYFDEKDPNYQKDIYEFLKQPFFQIENLWQKKTNQRKKFIFEFFGGFPKNSGRVGYQVLRQKMLGLA